MRSTIDVSQGRSGAHAIPVDRSNPEQSVDAGSAGAIALCRMDRQNAHVKGSEFAAQRHALTV